jgi:hypothetical protein
MTVAPTPVHGRAPHRRWLLAAAAAALVGAGIVIGLVINDQTGDTSTGVGVEGSGVPASETRDVASFAAVDLAGSNTVTIHVGGKPSVVVSADDNLLDHVTTRVDGGKLVIGTIPGSFSTRSPMNVDVTVPSLDALTLSGSGIVSADGIDSEKLTIALPGSGVLRASGTATTLDVDHSGSGDAQLEGLTATNVHAVLGGSGRIVVTATKSLDATVSGSGAIFYRGDPEQVATNVTGSGAVLRG